MHVDPNENTKIYLLWGTGPKDFLITKKSDTEVNWHVQPSNKFRENVLIPYLNLEQGGNLIILNKKSSLSWWPMLAEEISWKYKTLWWSKT